MLKYVLFVAFLTAAAGTSVIAQSKDEQAIAALIDHLNSAIISVDKKALAEITSDQLSFGHSSGKTENKAEFIEGVEKGPLKFSSIDLSDKTIILSGHNAIARHSFLGKGTVNGEPREISIKVLMVWQKENGRWKLLARQGYKI